MKGYNFFRGMAMVGLVIFFYTVIIVLLGGRANLVLKIGISFGLVVLFVFLFNTVFLPKKTKEIINKMHKEDFKIKNPLRDTYGLIAEWVSVAGSLEEAICLIDAEMAKGDCVPIPKDIRDERARLLWESRKEVERVLNLT